MSDPTAAAVTARLAIRVDGIVDFTAEVSAQPIDWAKFEPLRGLRLTVKALAEVLRKHLAWLRGQGRRANLRGADLSGADLSGADLTGADLSGANLRGANLRGANLRGADLSGANLSGADLTGADLSDANLRGANLSGADLRGANLSGADLSGADLSGANLSGANLRDANLSGADLSDANLRGADLRGADLRDANLRGADLSGARLPAPTVVLLAAWGALTPALTVEMMRLDAACHPDPAAFDRWAAGGGCPYTGCRVERAANFTESRDLWSPGTCTRPYDIMVAVLAEKCPEWTPEQRAAFEAKFTDRATPPTATP